MLLKIKEAIIVEGKYDKIKLSSIVDTVIVETLGFQIFKDPEQIELIRHLADTKGIIILTDSDGAGFLIRHYLLSIVDNKKIKNAYIPDIYGKEKRKQTASKEGKIGVEGISKKIILSALKRAGATFEPEKDDKHTNHFTKADLYEWGLSGKPNSSMKRKMFLNKMQLPERLSSNAMLKIINESYTREEIEKTFRESNRESILDEEGASQN